MAITFYGDISTVPDENGSGSLNISGSLITTGPTTMNILSVGVGQAIGQFSLAEGSGYAGTYGYLTSGSVVSGSIYLSSSYGDVSGDVSQSYLIYLKDNSIPSAELVPIISASWNGSNTIIYLTNTSFSSSTSGTIGLELQFQPTKADSVLGGLTSHAEGDQSFAIGYGSHAEGANTQAIGDYSHAEGYGTIAVGNSQHVSGKYNTYGDTTSLLIVGNGTNYANRKDAFKVTHSSSIVLPQTQSAAPTWTGINGEIIPATVSGSYYLYMWMNGAWRSSSFA